MHFKEKKNDDIKIYLAYVLLFALFVFKMFFYSNEGFSVADSRAHMSYIIYMEKNSDILIPKFEDIKMYGTTDVQMYKEGAELLQDNRILYKMEPQTATCYLGHPPLYYKLMQLCDVVHIAEDDSVYVDRQKVSVCNIMLLALTMMLVLITGYKVIEKKGGTWEIHLLFVAISTTLPMYAYLGSGATNDNLSNLGIVIFWMGLISYLDRGYCYKTFWLVACGIMISLLSKLTAGLIVALVTVIIVVVDIIKTKKCGIILNKYFVTTLPVYLLTLLYFGIIYVRYGGLQPSYSQVSSLEEFKSGVFYVAEENRVVLTFAELTERFFKGLWQTWNGTYHSSFMIEREGIFALAYVFVLLLFLGAALLEIISYIKKKGKTNNMVSVAFLVALIITVLQQFDNFYTGYMSRGYLGGYQARYYLPCIPIIAMGACECVLHMQIKTNTIMKNIKKYVVIGLAILLTYSDFIYFVTKIYA